MDSPRSVVSPLKNGCLTDLDKLSSENSAQSSGGINKVDGPRKEATSPNQESFIGALDVFVHQARDIHNICIYHKQDVYAKLYLTNDPENSVLTKIINGGGQNPVFDDKVRINVSTIESSLKCDIYMMSRVKNYLEDQLLGFALVPVSEVVINNGKLEKEFPLSSSDLFHSPAGFVHLSLSYLGTFPEVMAIPKLPSALTTDDYSMTEESLPAELDKIEFPDPQVANENQTMVTQYFKISAKSENFPDSETDLTVDSIQAPKLDSPSSSVSTNGVSSPSITTSEFSDGSATLKRTLNEEQNSAREEKNNVNVEESKSESSDVVANEKIVKPLITVNVEPEQKVVQQEIVDMYMKSMQQFTESLAKMKLPLDIDSPSSGSASSDQKVQQSHSSKNNGPRVFYGSRAFF